MNATKPEREKELIRIEKQIRQTELINRSGRKPFYWGGLAGYHQLQAISQALHQVISPEKESPYLHCLTQRVERVLEKKHTLADELQEAHQWLERIARCLRYPPSSYPECKSEETSAAMAAVKLTSQQVAVEMEVLLG